MMATDFAPHIAGQVHWLCPVIFLSIMIVVILLVDVFMKSKSGRVAYTLSALTTVIGIGFTWPLLGAAQAFEGPWVLGDHVTAVMLITLWALTFAAIVYGRGYLKAHRFFHGEFYALMLTSLLGALVLVMSNNLLTIYLGLELLSLPLYALIATLRDGTLGPEAAMKYFVMGAVASGFLLFGMSLVYATTHALTLPALMSALYHLPTFTLPSALPLVMGLVLMLIAMVFKLGAAPFHMWTPDVYEGAPLPVTTFLSTVPKVAVLGMLIHLIIQNLTPALSSHLILEIIAGIAVLSLLLGNILAVVQTNLKRLLAYSTIAHIGFVGLALSVGVVGEQVALFYMVIYALMSVGAFGLLTLMNQNEGHRGERVELQDLQGLAKRNGWVALMFLLILLSMAGIPPFIGFVAKLQVLMLLISLGHLGLAIFALLMSVIGAYYYIRVIKFMYFDPVREDAQPVEMGPLSLGQIVLCLNGLLMLVLGLFPATLLGWV